MSKKTSLLIVIILLCKSISFGANRTYSFNFQKDTASNHRQIPYHTSHKESFLDEFSWASAPLLAGGLFLKENQADFRSQSNLFVPKTERWYGDLTPYAPVGATAVLKYCGVETRSSWLRFAASSAFSGILMYASVNSIKTVTNELRPDGTENNSFPSGHTAAAFMSATIMHKELGSKSAWYSVGAYSYATLIGLSRILENHHWVNDVMFGAGLGIISTDIGYLIGDIAFKSEGLDNSYQSTSKPYFSDRPSFLSLGISMGLNNMQLNVPAEIPVLKMGAKTSADLEGTYFFNRYIGVGGRACFSTLPVTAIDCKKTITSAKNFESDNLKAINLSAGLYASYPLSPRWRMSTKLLLGDYFTTHLELSSINKSLPDEDSFETDKTIEIKSNHCLSLGTGVSIAYACKENTSLRLYVDYDYCAPRYKYRLNSGTSTARSHLNNWSIGVSFDIML